MKFICNKTELSEAIGSVSSAVSQRSTIPALSGIKVKVMDGSLELSAYNLEMGIRTTVSANTEGQGEFVVSPHLFSEFTRRMDGDDVCFEVNESLVINIANSSTDCTFPAISADEFPELPSIESGKSFTVKPSVLRSMINMTSYAASTNESKPILTGELFDIENNGFSLVAIDSFRLAIRNEKIDSEESFHFVVPKKALLQVASIIKDDDDKDCTVSVNQSHVIFRIGNVYVISRLLEGNFINYKLSIPSDCKTEVVIGKRQFTDCLERCALLNEEKAKAPVRCEIGDGMVKVNFKSSVGKINDEIKADTTGDKITIGINNRMFLDAMRAAEGDKIRMRFNGPLKVIEILPLENEDYIFLIMPIQLKN